MKTTFLLGVALLALSACSSTTPASPRPTGPEIFSRGGEPLYPPALKPEELAKREADLARAEEEHAAHPHDPDALIWHGRRLGYLGRFREAVVVFGQGIAEHPEDARMYRHRGHRWITLRRFDLAEASLEMAAHLVQGKPDEPEPPGIPNARGITVDTLNQNIYYHLALARYLRGDFEQSLAAWRECMNWVHTPDNLCSVTHWTFMTLRRLGRWDEATQLLEPIRADLDVVEYHAYHRLCLAYKGEISMDALWDEISNGDRTGSDFPTIGYGIAMCHLSNGRAQPGLEILREVSRAPLWPAFGRIAAEAEYEHLSRLKAAEDERQSSRRTP